VWVDVQIGVLKSSIRSFKNVNSEFQKRQFGFQNLQFPAGGLQKQQKSLLILPNFASGRFLLWQVREN